MREMNKSLLGFRQRHVPSSPTDPIKNELEVEVGLGSRRLSPIGESFSSTPPETEGEDKVFATSNNSKTGEETDMNRGRWSIICVIYSNQSLASTICVFFFGQISSPRATSIINWRTRRKCVAGLTVNR